MRLMLMRHGHAEGRGQDPPLTPHGVDAVRATAAGPWGDVVRIVHSPLLRSRQTAGLCAERWPDAVLVEDAAFVPSPDAEAAGARLLELAAGQGTVLLVSHLPLLPALCDWLCDAHRHFEPADAVLLEADDALAWRGAFTRVAP